MRDNEEIIDDYSISSENLKSIDDDNIFSSLKSNADIMKKFLDRFKKEYGNIENYLESVGINTAEKKVLTKKITGQD